ncbi:MAG: rhomboid family intramembrane serine protease [Chloroflexota bacterium]|nr:MAG: rhomboid family intramembrane serine protease [Chloroflexota bacterium]
MIPISTINNPTRRIPYLTYGLLLANIIVFIWQTTRPASELTSLFLTLSVVPCQLSQNPLSLESALDLLRSMFLHASWLHLLGNMLYLWLFGSNVEDYFGHKAFLGLYLGSGVVAALVQTLIYSHVCVPLVGASGAIAGVLGSFFILYPGVHVRVAVIFFRFFLRTVKLPALLVLGYWFLVQVFNGVTSLGVDTLSGGGVAFFAHIGGFVCGMVLTFIATMFNPPPRVPDIA